MEKVELDDMEQVEVFEHDIALYLSEFCAEQKIKTLKTESQSVWNAALMYVNKHVFPSRKILKSKKLVSQPGFPGKTTCGAYDLDMVSQICDIYIYICMKYEKEVSKVGFQLLTGIENATLATWKDGSRRGLSPLAVEIVEKLERFREESLSDKLADAKRNPVGILAILNRHFQWNLPGVSRERAQSAALGASELPKLGNLSSGAATQIEEKQDIVVDE